jgi:hypothetical protein
MDRMPITSFHLRSVGYDADTNTLEVEFRDGGLSRYSGVPASVHVYLMASASPGGYFNTHVKQAGYPCTKVR